MGSGFKIDYSVKFTHSHWKIDFFLWIALKYIVDKPQQKRCSLCLPQTRIMSLLATYTVPLTINFFVRARSVFRRRTRMCLGAIGCVLLVWYSFFFYSTTNPPLPFQRLKHNNTHPRYGYIQYTPIYTFYVYNNIHSFWWIIKWNFRLH